jgi:putative SOS response-associated peptidase YedK
VLETAPIIRRGAEEGTVELVMLRWSWPAPTGTPTFDFKSEDRGFEDHHVLISTDGFCEFTDQVPKAKLKHKWIFKMSGHRIFMIAGITRTVSRYGECFTMLTTEPGPDGAPYYPRQIVVLGCERIKALARSEDAAGRRAATNTY